VKWITRERVKVDRVACPRLIHKFIDPHAEFLFVPADKVISDAGRLGAIPAETDNSLWSQPESAGLNAIAEGFRHLGLKDDWEQNQAEWIIYDALYAYCQEMVRCGKSNGAFV